MTLKEAKKRQKHYVWSRRRWSKKIGLPLKRWTQGNKP